MTSTLPESRVKAERRIPAGLFLLLVTSLLNTFGCNGVFKERSQPLPYRLAVIPFGVGELGTDGPGTAGGGTGGGLMLRVEPSEAQKALVQRLSGIRFVQAAVLAGAGAGPEEPSGEEKDRSWIRAAVDARANLIMECDLKVGHRLESRLNEKFWLNLPLFLIGGPATYFVDDRSYRTPAHLLATIHLVEPLVEGRATLSDGRAILLRAEAQFEEASLAYYQRARLNPLSYLASLVIPCGFLEIENERVIRRLEREVTQGLAEALDRQLEKAWPRILRAEPVSDFYLDPGVEAVRDGDRVSLRRRRSFAWAPCPGWTAIPSPAAARR
jgi:hypothetical protein